MITPLIVAFLMAFGVYKAAAPPKAETPLRMSVAQSVGMSPLTLRVKVTAAGEGKAVCIVVDGPEFISSCRTLHGITWTMDFELRAGGAYAVYAVSGDYRTAELPVRVIGLGEVQ